MYIITQKIKLSINTNFDLLFILSYYKLTQNGIDKGNKPKIPDIKFPIIKHINSLLLLLLSFEKFEVFRRDARLSIIIIKAAKVEYIKNYGFVQNLKLYINEILSFQCYR